jgi:hypothetical protein
MSAKKGRFLQGVVRLTVLLTVGGTTLLLGGAYIGTMGVASPGTTINPSHAERDVYEFVSTLPKDAMLMGDPDVMSGIPLLSQRSVLFRALQHKPSAPILQFFDVYYAKSPHAVLDFCQAYSIDYLVINREQFAPDYLAASKFFYNPYNEVIAQTVAARTSFILPQIPNDRKLFQSDDLFVIPCEAHVFD